MKTDWQRHVLWLNLLCQDMDTPHFAKLFDIHMMCMLTGRERTEEEYASLFHEAGWRSIGTRYPASKLLGVVEAAKA